MSAVLSVLMTRNFFKIVLRTRQGSEFLHDQDPKPPKLVEEPLIFFGSISPLSHAVAAIAVRGVEPEALVGDATAESEPVGALTI